MRDGPSRHALPPHRASAHRIQHSIRARCASSAKPATSRSARSGSRSRTSRSPTSACSRAAASRPARSSSSRSCCSRPTSASPATLRLVEEVERLRAARAIVKTQDEFQRRAAREGVEAALRGGNSDPRSRIAAVDADGHSRHRRERRGEDDVHRQARRALARARARRVMVARRRHVSRRRDRSAARVGRAHRRGVRRRASRAPIRPRSRSTRSTPAIARGVDVAHHRHGRPPAHERRPDGRAEEGRARHREAAARRAARDAARARRHDRAERGAAGEDVRRRRCRSPGSS